MMVNSTVVDGPTCAWCGKDVALTPGPGRKRKYCSDSCKQRAYEHRAAVRGQTRSSEPAATRRAQRTLSDDVMADKLFELRCAAEDIATAVAEGAEHDEIDQLCVELVTMAKKLEKLR